MRGHTRELVTFGAIALTWGVLLLLEWRVPLRRAVEPKLRRIARNLTTSGLSFAVALALEAVLIVPVAQWTAAHGAGLANVAHLPLWAGVILLDYTLWWWHWASHNVPLLWRFHLVHHVDRDLDASTALRFHFGEHALSFGYRALQVVLLGVTLQTVWTWQTILFVSILFHHSNVRLPAGVERVLVRFVVTPRMHGIHHSDRRDEAFTNYSSLLAVWDALHRTLLLDVPQERIRIGVPAYSAPEDVTIGRILLLPFRRQREDWRAAGGAGAS